jgi:hypothetical protein
VISYRQQALFGRFADITGKAKLGARVTDSGA